MPTLSIFNPDGTLTHQDFEGDVPLETLQKAVGGYIEALSEAFHGLVNAEVWINEDGLHTCRAEPARFSRDWPRLDQVRARLWPHRRGSSTRDRQPRRTRAPDAILRGARESPVRRHPRPRSVRVFVRDRCPRGLSVRKLPKARPPRLTPTERAAVDEIIVAQLTARGFKVELHETGMIYAEHAIEVRVLKPVVDLPTRAPREREERHRCARACAERDRSGLKN